MISTSVKARLKHLDHASHLLYASSPSTSAFLQAQYNKVADDNDAAVPEERKRKICASCGSILIPGITARTSTVKKCPKRLNSVGNLKQETAFIECRKCNARTEYTVEPAVPKKTKAARKDSLAPKARANISSGLQSTAKQLAIQKRSRPRKSNNLQALLARSKAEAAGSTNTGFTLDLKDLLKGS